MSKHKITGPGDFHCAAILKRCLKPTASLVMMPAGGALPLCPEHARMLKKQLAEKKSAKKGARS